MKLIYSTDTVARAEELSNELARIDIPIHISGANAAELPGFSANYRDSSVGVWLMKESDFPRAIEVMTATGFLDKKRENANGFNGHAKLVIAAVMALIFAGVAAFLASAS